MQCSCLVVTETYLIEPVRSRHKYSFEAGQHNYDNNTCIFLGERDGLRRLLLRCWGSKGRALEQLALLIGEDASKCVLLLLSAVRLSHFANVHSLRALLLHLLCFSQLG